MTSLAFSPFKPWWEIGSSDFHLDVLPHLSPSVNHCMSKYLGLQHWVTAFCQSSYDYLDVLNKLLVLIQANKKCFQCITLYIVNMNPLFWNSQLNTTKEMHYSIFCSKEIFNTRSEWQKQLDYHQTTLKSHPGSSILSRSPKVTDYCMKYLPWDTCR